MARPNRHEIPPEDGGIVLDPPFADLPDLVRANAALRKSYDFNVLGIPAPVLADRTRSSIFEAAGAAPSDLVVATGHQPVLPHPGVWFKNHLVSRLATQLGCAGVNFIVDNDTVDLRTITVPAVVDGALAAADVPFIDCPAAVAAEEIEVPPGARDALAEVACLAGATLGDTIAAEFAAAAEPIKDLPGFVTRPRRRIEESFNVRNVELPVSALAETDAFRAFCAHLIAHADRFADSYNGALDGHRARRGITNPTEPSPNLSRKDDKVELPFWTWRPREGRRPLLVGPGDIADPAAALARLADAGRKLRPRGLAMTMFFRLFCCDLFVHGIGGANYEPVNDAIIREFFGVEPPTYAVASATLLIKPIASAPTDADLVEMRQRIRRMRTTPERFVGELLPDDAEARGLAERRTALLSPQGLSKRERREAYAESKRIASQLQERLATHILAAEKQAGNLEAARAVAGDRTWPFFLHSRAALEALYGRIDSPESTG